MQFLTSPFQDLLSVLSDLLDRKIEDNQSRYFLGNHEALLCIHTVLSILTGQGSSLTLDPQRFYNHLERVIADLKPTSADQNATYFLASRVLREAFVIRRKKITKLVLLQAIKHVGIASLHGGSKPLVEFLVIMDRLSRPILYFSMYFFADGQIHYYERRLYINVTHTAQVHT